ncbi:MAG: hypothetical protein KDC09_00230 [Bacteroidales bacterium]|nr:hypothetical protein [Bacteroidales bacterium]
MQPQSNQPITQENNQQIALPNSTTVLVLGIGSIVMCWCDGIVGLILSILALVLANRDLVLYQANPGKYTEKSYENTKTGRTIAIIGLVIAAVFLFALIIGLLFMGLNFALAPWDLLD